MSMERMRISHIKMSIERISRMNMSMERIFDLKMSIEREVGGWGRVPFLRI